MGAGFDYEKWLRNAFPLTVVSVTSRERWLAFTGDGWALSFDAAWRITGDGAGVFGWSSPAVSESVLSLMGLRVVDASFENRNITAMTFSNGWRLDVFADLDRGSQSIFVSGGPHVRVPHWWRRRPGAS